MEICPFCQKEFEPNHGNQRFCSYTCSEKSFVLSYKEKAKKNREKRKSSEGKLKRQLEHKTRSMRRFDLNLSDFYTMLEEQNSKCYICKSDIDFSTARIDHCHASDRIRRLLCDGCNVALGRVKENIMILENMIRYIKEFENFKETQT